ncbi:hypothetical protein, partial [Aeromonas salmonicida]|uniref:hypothetical protein n=1 Tax=Aeromonas salmonicida TaxID=645 RepID=UPI003D0825D9
KPNQQVSDFYTSAGLVNGSLTDRHYGFRPVFCFLPSARISLQAATIGSPFFDRPVTIATKRSTVFKPLT